MRQIRKQAGSISQFFKTTSFAFMKIFCWLVNVVVFGAFQLFFGWFVSQITAESPAQGLYNQLKYLATELNFWLQFVTRVTQVKQKSSKKGYID